MVVAVDLRSLLTVAAVDVKSLSKDARSQTMAAAADLRSLLTVPADNARSLPMVAA